MKKKYWMINISVVVLHMLTLTILYVFFDLFAHTANVVILGIVTLILGSISHWNYRKHYKTNKDAA